MRRLVPLATAVVLAAFSFLPIANWLPGGRQQPRYGAFLDGWLSGTAIVLGVGVVLAIASRRMPWLWRAGVWDALADRWERAPARVTVGIALASLVLYAVIALSVFDGRPLLIDELVQSLQARIFAGGRLFLPTHAEPAFFSLANVVDAGGKTYGQFPPGWSAMLAIGEVLRVPWLVGPIAGAVAVGAFGALLRAAEPRRGVALGALCLFAGSPFIAFMAGSYMNHVPAVAGILAGLACMAWAFRSATPRPWLGFWSGVGFGVAATMRPVDALAFALPAGVWYLWRALRDPKRWGDGLPALVGVLIPLGALFWFNAQTSGAPMTFGFTVLWGPNHSLGFHLSPWGQLHTPAMGAQLINLYFLRLQTNLFETPLPGMLPAIVALGFVPRLSAHEQCLLAGSTLLALCYWAYFHDGYYLGARFFIPLVPLLAWMTAQLPALLRAQFGAGAMPVRVTVYGYAVAALVGAAAIVPLRVHDYHSGLVTMRWDHAGAARAAGVRDALVFVRESWGSQVMARLWGRGVSRGDAEVLYKRVDLCALDSAIASMEREHVTGAAALARLQPMVRDSSALGPMPETPDPSGRRLRGAYYPPRCEQRLAEDRAGFTLAGPMLLSRDGNVYVRDLHGRDSLLLTEYPARDAWILAPASSDEGATPVFHRASRDSILAAARSEALSLLPIRDRTAAGATVAAPAGTRRGAR